MKASLCTAITLTCLLTLTNPGIATNIYKCESGGQLVFSDEPCGAASEVVMDVSEAIYTAPAQDSGLRASELAYLEQLQKSEQESREREIQQQLLQEAIRQQASQVSRIAQDG